MSANKLNARCRADVQLIRAGHKVPVKTKLEAPSKADLRGDFVVEHWRGGHRINEYHFQNGIVNEGKNALLDIMFDVGTQISSWYLGLIDNANFSALANDDTYDDIDQAGNGWDEFTSYTDANNGDSATTRPEWGPDAAASQSISNSTVAVYDVTASGTVKGVFAVGGGTTPQTKGDHDPSSTLWATALFSSGDVAVQNGDQLKITYTVSV